MGIFLIYCFFQIFVELKQSPEDFVVDEILDLVLEPNGSFSYFILRKEDYSTENAILFVAKKLGVDRKRINYCGAKDKVAVTSQYISVQQLSKDRRINYNFQNIQLEYIGQGETRLTLGSHKGNNFIIIVRNTPLDFESRNPNKVSNFFGEQRFSKNNADIGKAIIKKDFKTAVTLVLESDGKYEKEVNYFLSEHPNNYLGALKKVPFKILTMFIHAYQSRLFNDVAADWPQNSIPIIGFNTDESVVSGILAKENLSTRDFIIRAFPELSSEGDVRDKYMSISNFSSQKLARDVWKFSFSLGKGSYATVLIDWLFRKNEQI